MEIILLNDSQIYTNNNVFQNHFIDIYHKHVLYENLFD